MTLRRPVVTARGSVAERSGYVVELTAPDGEVGVGEVAPLDGFPGPTRRGVEAAIGSWRPGRAAPLEIAGALDTARVDAAGKRLGASASVLLGDGVAVEEIDVNRLVGLGSAGGCPAGAVTKIKVGVQTWDEERKILADLVSRIGGRSVRLDANGAWDAETAVRALEDCERWDIELIEDPVPGAEECDRLASLTGARVALDGPVAGANAEGLLELTAIAAFVVKPAVCGGPISARRLIDRLEDGGRGWIVTHFLDSVIGRTMAVHVAGAGQGPRHPCGLLGGYLSSDLAEVDIEPSSDRCRVPAGPGLGVPPLALFGA